MLDVLINHPEEKPSDKKGIRISDRADKPVKSAIKAISWRIVGTIDTMIISYFITGRVTVALSIGSAEVITKTILYYFHERLWAHIHRIRINILKKRSNVARNKPEGDGNNTHRKNNSGIPENTGINIPGQGTLHNQLWN